MLVERHMLRTGEHGFGGSGNDLGMITGRYLGQGRHDALHIHDHRFDCSGDDGQFLLQEVAGYRHPMAHQDFIAGTAHAADIDAAGSCRPGLGQQFRISGRENNDVRQSRFMAVENDIDLIGFNNAQITSAFNRLRGAEKHVGQLGGPHGAAPAVAQGSAQAVQSQIDIVGVDSHMSAVHAFHYFPVNAPGSDTQFGPQVFSFLGRTLQQLQTAFAAAEFIQSQAGQIQGDFPGGASLHRDTAFLSQGLQLGFVLDRVIRRVALHGFIEGGGDIASVIGMGGGAGGNHAEQVASHDSVGIGPANPFMRFLPKGVDTAGAHIAIAAADSQFAEAALGLLLGQALPGGADVFGGRFIQHFEAGFIHTFDFHSDDLPFMVCRSVQLFPAWANNCSPTASRFDFKISPASAKSKARVGQAVTQAGTSNSGQRSHFTIIFPWA